LFTMRDEGGSGTKAKKPLKKPGARI